MDKLLLLLLLLGVSPFVFFHGVDKWRYNHTQLDCEEYCSPLNFYYGALKISTFCCKGQDFCNRYQGKGKDYKIQ